MPFLGNLPLVGKLFSKQKPVKTRTELLILMTPRLITGETLIGSSDSLIGESPIKTDNEFSKHKEGGTQEVALEHTGTLKPYKKP